MMIATFLDFWTPSTHARAPLSLSHSRNLSVLSYAFGVPPSPSKCGHHMYMPPETSRRRGGVEWICAVEGEDFLLTPFTILQGPRSRTRRISRTALALHLYHSFRRPLIWGSVVKHNLEEYEM